VPLDIATPGKTRIGWIGTGVMGRSMCGHLIDAGYTVAVYNRTRSRAEPLLAQGARWADSPREVAAASDIVFSIVGYPADVRQAILAEGGALAGARRGSILVDMTTSEPSLAVEIAAAAKQVGAASLDAPVSGGDVGARNATLSIMVGGESTAVAAVMPCLKVMAKTIVHQGSHGAGQHTKMVNQILVAASMIGVCESLLYAHKAGLDLPKVLESVSTGAAGSWTLANLAPRIIAGDFAPGFFVEHFIKDMRIVLDEAARMNLVLPGLALVHQLYTALAAQGHARDGTHALQFALAKLSNIDWPSR
jgi:3-hydroxyisobutyrate dehydrogenase